MHVHSLDHSVIQPFSHAVIQSTSSQYSRALFQTARSHSWIKKYGQHFLHLHSAFGRRINSKCQTLLADYDCHGAFQGMNSMKHRKPWEDEWTRWSTANLERTRPPTTLCRLQEHHHHYYCWCFWTPVMQKKSCAERGAAGFWNKSLETWNRCAGKPRELPCWLQPPC